MHRKTAGETISLLGGIEVVFEIKYEDYLSDKSGHFMNFYLPEVDLYVSVTDSTAEWVAPGKHIMSFRRKKKGPSRFTNAQFDWLASNFQQAMLSESGHEYIASRGNDAYDLRDLTAFSVIAEPHEYDTLKALVPSEEDLYDMMLRNPAPAAVYKALKTGADLDLDKLVTLPEKQSIKMIEAKFGKDSRKAKAMTIALKAKIKAIEKTGDVLRKMPMNNPKVRRASEPRSKKNWWDDFDWDIYSFNNGYDDVLEGKRRRRYIEKEDRYVYDSPISSVFIYLDKTWGGDVPDSEGDISIKFAGKYAGPVYVLQWTDHWETIIDHKGDDANDPFWKDQHYLEFKAKIEEIKTTISQHDAKRINNEILKTKGVSLMKAKDKPASNPKVRRASAPANKKWWEEYNWKPGSLLSELVAEVDGFEIEWRHIAPDYTSALKIDIPRGDKKASEAAKRHAEKISQGAQANMAYRNYSHEYHLVPESLGPGVEEYPGPWDWKANNLAWWEAAKRSGAKLDFEYFGISPQGIETHEGHEGKLQYPLRNPAYDINGPAEKNPVEMVDDKPVDIMENYYSVIYRQSRTFDQDAKGRRILRYPKNMQKAAVTITSENGAKVRAGLLKGKWAIQAVLIPRRRGMTKRKAVKLGDEVVSRLTRSNAPRLRMNPALGKPDEWLDDIDWDDEPSAPLDWGDEVDWDDVERNPKVRRRSTAEDKPPFYWLPDEMLWEISKDDNSRYRPAERGQNETIEWKNAKGKHMSAEEKIWAGNIQRTISWRNGARRDTWLKHYDANDLAKFEARDNEDTIIHPKFGVSQKKFVAFPKLKSNQIVKTIYQGRSSSDAPRVQITEFFTKNPKVRRSSEPMEEVVKWPFPGGEPKWKSSTAQAGKVFALFDYKKEEIKIEITKKLWEIYDLKNWSLKKTNDFMKTLATILPKDIEVKYIVDERTTPYKAYCKTGWNSSNAWVDEMIYMPEMKNNPKVIGIRITKVVNGYRSEMSNAWLARWVKAGPKSVSKLYDLWEMKELEL